MSGGITWKNKSQVLNRLNSFEDGIDQATESTAAEIGTKLRAAVQSNLYPGHGVDTGFLRSSYQAEIVERRKCWRKLKLWTECTYAPFVEFRWGGRIAHFWPGIQSVEPHYMEIWRSHLNRRAIAV